MADLLIECSAFAVGNESTVDRPVRQDPLSIFGGAN